MKKIYTSNHAYINKKYHCTQITFQNMKHKNNDFFCNLLDPFAVHFVMFKIYIFLHGNSKKNIHIST